MDTHEFEGPEKKKLRVLAAQILAEITKLPVNEKPKKDSAFVRVYDSASGHRREKFTLGRIAPEKFQRYKDLSLEKAMRVLSHPEYPSSFFGMDEKKDMWPGAVRAARHIVSVSGLTWRGDEALALQLAIEMHWLDAASAFNIARISDNTLFQELYHKRREDGHIPGGRT